MKRHLPFQNLDSDAWYRLTTHAAHAAWLLLLGGAIVGAWLWGGVDFKVYHAATRTWLQGSNPYDFAQVRAILETITGQSGNPYYYAPWFLFAVVPFSVLPFHLARAAWALCNGLLFWSGCRLAVKVLQWNLDGWRRPAAYISALYLFGWMTLRFEQAAIFIFVMLMAALVFWQRRMPWATGVCLVLAATKPQPAWIAIAALMLFGYMVFRPVVWTTVTAGFALLLIAAPLTVQWATLLFSSDARRGLAYTFDESADVAAVRINTTFFDWAASMKMPAYIAQTGYIAIALIVIFFVFTTVFRNRSLSDVASVGLVGSVLLAPYILQYDYVPLTFVLFYIYKTHRRSLTEYAVGLLLVVVFSVPLWEQPISDGYWIALLLGGALALRLVTGENIAAPADAQPASYSA